MRDFGWVILDWPMNVSWYNVVVYFLLAVFMWLQINYPEWSY